MAASATAGMLSRLTSLRNAVRNINNTANITPSINRNLPLVTRKYSVDINSIIDTSEDEIKPKKTLSKAMRAYLERAREHDEFMKAETTKYEIGKRHLANMMGENAETFTQADVNKSIRYLFPSSLYEKKARPVMESPDKIFPQKKAAEFDETGRPYHPLFYTCKPYYYQLLHDIVANIYKLNDIEDKSLRSGVLPHSDEQIDLLSSNWMDKKTLEKHVLETLTDEQHEKFVAAAQRLADHPYAHKVNDFIMKLRTKKTQQTEGLSIPECKYTPEGRPYVKVKDCKRKSARATVTVLSKGEGKITINGQDIRYFSDIQSREQIP